MPQQAVLGAVQRLAGRLAQRDRAEQVVPVPDRNHPARGVGGREAVRRGQLHRGGRRGSGWPDGDGAQFRADPDPCLHPRGPGRARQQRHHPVQGVTQVDLPGHVGGEIGQDLIRRGPFAIDQAVGQPCGPRPQRLEQQGDGHGRSDGQQRVAAVSHECPGAQHDGRVHRGDRRRQQGDQQGTADDDVDVEQPVLQDRDRHGRRDCEQHEERRNGIRHMFERRVLLTCGDGQDGDDLAGQHPGNGQPQPLHLLTQPPVPPAVTQRQRYQRGHQHQQQQHPQGVQGTEPRRRLK